MLSKERRKAYRLANKVKFAEYQRSYRLRNLSKVKEGEKNWRQANPESRALTQHNYHSKTYQSHPRIRIKYLTSSGETIKRKARVAAQSALKSGIISKGKCAFCHSFETQMHHVDYERPLDVVWVCRKHHLAIHYDGITIPSLVAL